MAKNSRTPLSVKEAKEQAAEYFGFTASVFIQTDDGKVWEIPNPGLMDDDQLMRYEELQFELEECEREEDIVIPERVIEDDDGNKITVPARTIRGELKIPHRKFNPESGKVELLKPPYSVRLAIALFGEKGYKEYKAGGGIANQIALEWNRMNREYMERVQSDPKSDGGDSPLEIVSEGD